MSNYYKPAPESIMVPAREWDRALEAVAVMRLYQRIGPLAAKWRLIMASRPKGTTAMAWKQAHESDERALTRAEDAYMSALDAWVEKYPEE